jgi:hypothetical protein
LIRTLVFWENANFFRRKLSKIDENCDRNIDPWSKLKAANFPLGNFQRKYATLSTRSWTFRCNPSAPSESFSADRDRRYKTWTSCTLWA